MPKTVFYITIYITLYHTTVGYSILWCSVKPSAGDHYMVDHWFPKSHYSISPNESMKVVLRKRDADTAWRMPYLLLDIEGSSYV